MKLLDRLVQETHDKDRRLAAAEGAFNALRPEERREFIARWILRLQADEKANDGGLDDDDEEGDESAVPLPSNTEKAGPLTGSYLEKADQFIQAHPKGVRTRDVAEAIGQDTKNVDGTLRILLDRGRAERRDRRWWPVPATPTVPTIVKPKRIRDYIYDVFAGRKGSGSTGLSTAEIFGGIQAVKPTISRASVDGEVNRMKRENLITQVGSNGRGGLYALTNGGAHAAAH